MGKSIKDVEFIVGIPSYMEADSIAFVTKQVDKGLVGYFKDLNTLIVNVDNNSSDDTRGVFLSAKTKTPKHYITTPEGIKGKGNNFLNLFRFGKKFKGTLKGAVVGYRLICSPFFMASYSSSVRSSKSISILPCLIPKSHG